MFPELSPLVSAHLFSVVSTFYSYFAFSSALLIIYCAPSQPPCHAAHRNTGAYFALTVFNCSFGITTGKDALSLSPKPCFNVTLALHWIFEKEKNKKAPDLAKILKPRCFSGRYRNFPSFHTEIKYILHGYCCPPLCLVPPDASSQPQPCAVVPHNITASMSQGGESGWVGMAGTVEAGTVGNTGGTQLWRAHWEMWETFWVPGKKSPLEKAFPTSITMCLCLGWCARIAEHHVFHIFVFVNQC